MVSETILIITIVGTALLSPVLNYMYNSRCTHIDCFCVKCDRELRDEDDSEQREIPNN